MKAGDIYGYEEVTKTYSPFLCHDLLDVVYSPFSCHDLLDVVVHLSMSLCRQSLFLWQGSKQVMINGGRGNWAR